MRLHSPTSHIGVGVLALVSGCSELTDVARLGLGHTELSFLALNLLLQLTMNAELRSKTLHSELTGQPHNSESACAWCSPETTEGDSPVGGVSANPVTHVLCESCFQHLMQALDRHPQLAA